MNNLDVRSTYRSLVLAAWLFVASASIASAMSSDNHAGYIGDVNNALHLNQNHENIDRQLDSLEILLGYIADHVDKLRISAYGTGGAAQMPLLREYISIYNATTDAEEKKRIFDKINVLFAEITQLRDSPTLDAKLDELLALLSTLSLEIDGMTENQKSRFLEMSNSLNSFLTEISLSRALYYESLESEVSHIINMNNKLKELKLLRGY